MSNHLAESIKGQQSLLSVDTLRAGADVARIRKIYKLGSPPIKQMAPNGAVVDDHISLQNMEVQVLGMMALRGAS